MLLYNRLTKRNSESIFFPVLNSKGQEWEVESYKMGCQVNYPNLLNTRKIFLGYSLMIIKCCRDFFPKNCKMAPFTGEYVIERRNRRDLKTSHMLCVYHMLCVRLLKQIAHDKKLSQVYTLPFFW